MKPSRLFFSVFIIAFALALVGCSQQNNAATAIEAYIQALAAQDADQLAIVSCAEWESSAQVELDSFSAVSTVLENLSCQEGSQDANGILISCSGKIILDYSGEIQELDLSSRGYLARQEGGEWRMCGYR